MFEIIEPIPDGIHHQVLAEMDKAGYVFNKSIVIKRASFNTNGEWVLGVYKRVKCAKYKEAGLFYGFGPSCQDIDSFPFKMLRLFSLKNQCFNCALEYYKSIVKKYGLKSKTLNDRLD